MKALKKLNNYFLKYKFLLLMGLFFTVSSRVFAVIAPSLVGDSITQIEKSFSISASNLKDNEVINIISSLFNLFLLETGSKKESFRNGAYFFMDEMDLLKNSMRKMPIIQ